MSTAGGNSSDRIAPIDDDYVGNLDALTRDLDDIEMIAASALSDKTIDHAVTERLAGTPTDLTYSELTAHHQERREVEGWGEAEIADILDPFALEQLDGWRAAQRLPWERGDLVVVGISGLIGALGNLYDDHVDAAVLSGLSLLKKTDLLRRWERQTARLPIDYTGPEFGGPAHRVRSAGHDIGRFFAALNQIRTGTFEGTWWDDGQRMVAQVTTTRSGLPFAQAPQPHLAVALLLKHWAADFVTPMNLPLPGWTLLYEMPNPDLRKFAHEAYAGTNSGDGLNLRSGMLTPGLGMLATEVVIRTHTHLGAYRSTGTSRLTTSSAAKHTEMLLAAHAAAGAISLSKTAAATIAGETVVAARHLNLPVLVRIGMLALKVRSDAAARAEAGAPSWEQLLADDAATWTLPEAVTIADLLTNSVGPSPADESESLMS
ncbi:hypothetical protein SAMN04244553_6511 [Nocardia amikacinitolerans]|uniref:Uncharacterized protein n=1 Tax=Nocardia amikacinitolerans TaxID=756689 RepID=A0A285LYF3_9NOCA|nr:hypothetical protein [Nocardia amikacinitolerans]MCP2279587.1 hypothetical protein [Nocardia amikacinitolerans]MCP2298601.1 hypothetical protein [Nocardia amikacinitolerans]SNY89493.1 hypothetical protein SAMN04244553_6511 [Nocardia amikacinitolerans]